MIYPQQDEQLFNHTMSIPPDLIRWWRRMTTLERGMIHNVSLVIPKAKTGKVTWGVMASAKLENEE